MRLGLVSDIHADLPGLERALEILRREGAEQILCAGDLVEKGMLGDGVINFLRDSDIPCVRGNHDEMVIGNQLWLRENGDPANPNYHARLLTDETLKYLQNLPAQLNYDWAGKRVLLTHGTTRSNNEYLYPNSPDDLFERVAREAQTDILVLGHTHKPMRADVGGVRIFNPGSVYSEGSQTCAILDLLEDEFEVYKISSGARVPVSDLKVIKIG